ncbi:MAG: hypothetical protein AB1428_09215 [Bacteroidota bacterium]
MQRINTGSILFDRNLNTYNWIGRAAVDTTAGPLRIGLLQQYAANIIRLEGVPPGGRDRLHSTQQTVTLSVRAPVSLTLTPLVQWSSMIYTDEKGTGLNNASTSALLGGVEYAAAPWLLLSPVAGYRWDSQAGIRDQGLAYMLGARVPGLDADGYQISGSAQFREDRVSPRKLEGHFARIGIEKAFSRFTRDSLEAGFTRSRREFYALADSNVESRTEQVFTFVNRLDYDFDPSLTTSLFVGINGRGLEKELRNWNAVAPREVQFDTHIDELRLDSYVQASYRSADGRAGGWLRLYYSERTESHTARRPGVSTPAIDLRFAERMKQEQLKDNASRRTVLNGAVNVPLSLSDNLSLSGSAGILRYDTPSDLNVEDRDELLFAVTLATSHRLSPVLDLGIVLDGTLSHTVYLLKERSANNSINRVLRLSPRTIFRPVAWIASLNAFEVLANYTVYDFEQQLASVKSFSYRQFGWIDSTSVDLTHRLGVDFYAYWRVYERGQLKWSDFKELTENAAVEQTYALQVRVRPGDRMYAAVGLRYFGQSRYIFVNGDRLLDSFLSSFGPTSTLVWKPGTHSRIQFQGWYERRRQPDGSIKPLSTMTMSVSLTL